MARFTVSFETDNATFDPDWRIEAMAMLRGVIRAVREETDQGLGKHNNIVDSNGNIIGTWKHGKGE